ncbi:MAG TPA: aldo/keto reductase [Polyangiaceae bacterium]|nr:aldo/keto reductase [Polyangiaceae bacterium]
MELQNFGNTSLRVTRFGLGCARLGGVFQSNSRGFLDLLAFAFDSGVNFFDTADMYSQGESESLIGKALGRKRDRIVIASKAGYTLPSRRRWAGRVKPLLRPLVRLLKLRRSQLSSGSRGQLAQDFSPKHLLASVEGSLRRLRTDYLDVLQLHSPPLEVVEQGEWLPALEELKRSGKVRYYGVAVDSIEAGLAALRYPQVASLQFTLNLLEPAGASELFPEAQRRGVAGIARECLANGLLVKSAAEIELKSYCSSPEQEAQRIDQLSALQRTASESGRSVLQSAVAYPSSVPGVSVTLLGARNVEQLRTLLDAARA